MERLVGALQALPHRARRSITFDRGTEFTALPYLQVGIGAQTLVLRPAIALAEEHRREHKRPGQEMALTRRRSPLPHRPRTEGNLRALEHHAAKASGLQDAGRSLPAEASRPDAVSRIGSHCRKSRLNENSQPYSTSERRPVIRIGYSGLRCCVARAQGGPVSRRTQTSRIRLVDVCHEPKWTVFAIWRLSYKKRPWRKLSHGLSF